MRSDRSEMRVSAALIALFLMTFLLSGGGPKHWFSGSSNILSAAMVLLWMTEIERRVLHRTVRRLLTSCGTFLVLFFLLQTFKYIFPDAGTAVHRYAEYGYQIPLSFAAMLSFLASQGIGRNPEQNESIDRWRWLIVPCLLLSLGFLSSDLHGLAYRLTRDTLGAPGPLYYAALVWQVCLLLGTLGASYARSRLVSRSRSAAAPLAVLLTGMAYFILYFLNGGHPLNLGPLRFQFPNVYAAMLVFFWMSCLQTGLLPSNGAYADLFSHATVRAAITDGQGRLWRSAAKTLPDLPDVAETPVLPDENTRLHSRAIAGGRVWWVDDLTPVNIQRRELEELTEELNEESNLLQKENEARSTRPASRPRWRCTTI